MSVYAQQNAAKCDGNNIKYTYTHKKDAMRSSATTAHMRRGHTHAHLHPSTHSPTHNTHTHQLELALGLQDLVCASISALRRCMADIASTHTHAQIQIQTRTNTHAHTHTESHTHTHTHTSSSSRWACRIFVCASISALRRCVADMASTSGAAVPYALLALMSLSIWSTARWRSLAAVGRRNDTIQSAVCTGSARRTLPIGKLPHDVIAFEKNVREFTLERKHLKAEEFLAEITPVFGNSREVGGVQPRVSGSV